MLSERELAEFKRGPLQMLVLFLLAKEDMYGYQLTQRLNQTSHGLFPVTEGALYIVLYRLIKRGHISKKQETGVKKPRVFYHLEASGKELLHDLLQAYNSMQTGIAYVLQEQDAGLEGDSHG